MGKAVKHVQAVATRPPEVLKSEFAPVTLAKHFKITPSGLTVDGNPTFDTCAVMWEALRTLEHSLQFAIGDYINYLEQRWGEKSAQIIDATGLTLSSIKVYSWVARQVPADNRYMDRGLTYTHHQVVAGMNSHEQKTWLRQACGNGGEPWPVSRLRAAINNGSDIAPSGWYVVVACDSEAQQQELVKKLEREGLNCRTAEKRKKKRELAG